MGQRQPRAADDPNEEALDDGVLAHSARRALFERIDASPGVSVRALSRALGVHDKTVLYHARVLEGAGLVVVARWARRTACYRRGREPGAALQGMAPELAAVLRALAAGHEGATDVARAVGVPRGTAWGQLATLRRLGLADVRDGRWVAAAGERFSREAGLGGPS